MGKSSFLFKFHLPSFLHSFIPSILTTTSIFSFILIQFTHSLQMEGAQRTTSSLVDREERAVAALLTRFKTLITLAAEPVEDGATKEMAAAHGLQMEVEGSALVRATEDLLQLSHELKELWLFGPLRGIKEGEGEGQMDVDSQKVGELVEAALKRAAEHPPSK